jgi:hypothetical protein
VDAQAKLTATGGAADDEFGNAVAIADDAIVGGAHLANLPTQSDAGSAYVFRRTGAMWAPTQILIPTGTPGFGPELGDLFGDSVAIGGSTLVVGSSGADIPETAAGAVYVFAANSAAGLYGLDQKLTIPGGTNGDHFGCSVALEGSTIIAGAREDWPITSEPAYGAAYVFERNGATATTPWISQGKLIALDPAEMDRFGWSVAVSNNVVAVGARGDDTKGARRD